MLLTGLGYFLISQAIDQAFDKFAQGNTHRQVAEFLKNLLTNYYVHTGSWQGLEQFLQRSGRQVPFVLVDREGKVVVAPEDERGVRRLLLNELHSGLPIEVDRQIVGTLLVLPPPPPPWRSPLEAEFLQSVNMALWLAGLLVGGIALLLSYGLLRHLTVPLRELDAATQQITQGQRSKRVPVRSHDELGHLAQSFNEMAESLERSEQTKRDLIAEIAHELRTPISSVQIGLEGLIDGVLPPMPESFAALHNKTLLISRLVDDLQQLALADAGQLSVQKQPCDLRDLLQHIQATIGVQLEEQEIQLRIELPRDLPEILADVHRVEQVLLNLLSNAARYTPAGGTIRVVASVPDHKFVHISVCDSGPGLSEEDLRHLFERFYRADKSRSRQSGGSGLGLAIAKALIEAQGGRIWAENSPEGGACFQFTLPQSPQF